MISSHKMVIEVLVNIGCQADSRDRIDVETGINNLALARAKAVSDYIVYRGIAPNRVFYRGFGHSIPLHPYPEKTEKESMENRRVEIKIISK